MWKRKHTSDLRTILSKKAAKDKEIEHMKQELKDASRGKLRPTYGQAVMKGANIVGGKLNQYAIAQAKYQKKNKGKKQRDPFDGMF